MKPLQTHATEAPRVDNAPTSVQTAIDNMNLSLTVLYAQTQLLRRRVETGLIRDARECLRVLETIEQHAGDLAQSLRQVHQASSGRSTSTITEHSRRIA
jgi:hypothetical protein